MFRAERQAADASPDLWLRLSELGRAIVSRLNAMGAPLRTDRHGFPASAPEQSFAAPHAKPAAGAAAAAPARVSVASCPRHCGRAATPTLTQSGSSKASSKQLEQIQLAPACTPRLRTLKLSAAPETPPPSSHGCPTCTKAPVNHRNSSGQRRGVQGAPGAERGARPAADLLHQLTAPQERFGRRFDVVSVCDLSHKEAAEVERGVPHAAAAAISPRLPDLHSQSRHHVDVLASLAK